MSFYWKKCFFSEATFHLMSRSFFFFTVMHQKCVKCTRLFLKIQRVLMMWEEIIKSDCRVALCCWKTLKKLYLIFHSCIWRKVIKRMIFWIMNENFTEDNETQFFRIAYNAQYSNSLGFHSRSEYTNDDVRT